jgi:drug/metabolite transporter (DMT)-like permease
MSSVNSHQRGSKGGIVKKVTKTWVVAVVLFFVSIWVVVIPGVTTLSQTEQIQTLSQVILPAAIVAALLFAYFEWRTALVSRLRDERHKYEKRL